MAQLHLGLRLSSSNKFERVTLNNVNLSDKVETIRKEVASRKQISPNSIQLVHYGVLLNDTDTLQDAGIASGSLIHCLPKYDSTPPPVPPMGLLEVQHLLVSLRAAVSSPGFRNFVQKLRKPDMVEKVFSGCPFACHDPSAISFLQDPELFITLANPDDLNKVVEERPVVGRIAQFVADMMVNEVPSPQRSRHVSYSMDALSDEEEEEMEGELSGDSLSASRASGSIAIQPITPAQLAAALANATGGRSNSLSGHLSTSAPHSLPLTPSSAVTPFNTPAPLSASSGGAGASPGPITTEMFSQALQNALAASASRGSGPLSSASSTSSLSVPPASSAPLANLEESLQLMREMGIGDEEMSRQALQATSGDVQAAVNLIFAQWMADD